MKSRYSKVVLIVLYLHLEVHGEPEPDAAHGKSWIPDVGGGLDVQDQDHNHCQTMCNNTL